jgi:hypothetical protein
MPTLTASVACDRHRPALMLLPMARGRYTGLFVAVAGHKLKRIWLSGGRASEPQGALLS